MPTLFRWFSALLFISALAALGMLLISVALNYFGLAAIHRQAGALSLVLIGSSYIALQLSSRSPSKETIKAALLGLGFLLWGSEQFLPSSSWVAAMDTAVVLIFVVDLSLIIVASLKRKVHE
jgi:hypothetical protein